MCTAVGSVNVINKCVYALVKAVVMLESNLNINIVFCAFGIKNLVINRRFALIKVLNKLLNTAFVMEGFFLLFAFSFILNINFKTFS